jgi:hypothetical protein
MQVPDGLWMQLQAPLQANPEKQELWHNYQTSTT